MAILFKFLLPLIIFFWILRKVFRGVRLLVRINQKLSDPTYAQTNPTDHIIDICPSCGNVKTPHHRCS